MRVRGIHRAAGTVLAAAVAPVVVAVAPAVADTTAVTVAEVPEVARPAVEAGSRACAELPPSVLASQLKVASGFDPDAARPDGATGIAGLRADEWAQWGSDADGDGSASPLDPADAGDALARRMCSLYRTAVGTDLRGDRLRLALGAFDAGWSAVQAAGGVPASAQDYVARVLDLSWRYGRAGGEFGHTAAPPPATAGNPRSPAEAIAWARAQQGGATRWPNLCLNFTAQAYGWSYSGTRFAIDHYLRLPRALRHPGDRTPPPGALLFWDTGRRAGHVALALGHGMIASNDIEVRGGISVVPARAIEERWGARYLGWSAPSYPGGGMAASAPAPGAGVEAGPKEPHARSAPSARESGPDARSESASSSASAATPTATAAPERRAAPDPKTVPRPQAAPARNAAPDPKTVPRPQAAPARNAAPDPKTVPRPQAALAAKEQAAGSAGASTAARPATPARATVPPAATPAPARATQPVRAPAPTRPATLARATAAPATTPVPAGADRAARASTTARPAAVTPAATPTVARATQPPAGATATQPATLARAADPAGTR